MRAGGDTPITRQGFCLSGGHSVPYRQRVVAAHEEKCLLGRLLAYHGCVDELHGFGVLGLAQSRVMSAGGLRWGSVRSRPRKGPTRCKLFLQCTTPARVAHPVLATG